MGAAGYTVCHFARTRNPLAKPNYSFEKRQRELAKKKKKEEKAARKRADKAGGGSAETAAAHPRCTWRASMAATRPGTARRGCPHSSIPRAAPATGGSNARL